MRVSVVGAGIIGLTTARHLAAAGHRVTVLADRFGEDTTSAVAAAIWLPYFAEPRDRVLDWGARGLAALSALADEPGSGVRVLPGTQLFRDGDEDPWWLHVVASRKVTDVPAGFAWGLAMRLPVVDMAVHLPWLLATLQEAGVSVVHQRVSALSAVDGDLVVNCTGRGAQDLVPGEVIAAVRGQVVHLAQPGIAEWVLEDTDPAEPTYVVPRERTVVCGGLAVESDDLEPDPETTRRILDRCRALVPALATAPVVAERVGLRPARHAVRLERDGDGVLHCYGHGGAGVTLAHGCAQDIVALAGA